MYSIFIFHLKNIYDVDFQKKKMNVTIACIKFKLTKKFPIILFISTYDRYSTAHIFDKIIIIL